MLVFNSLEEAKKSHISNVGLTIGNFDGCHLGHQKLIEVLKSEAGADIKIHIITFDPMPEQVLSPHPPLRLFPISEQLLQFQEHGVASALVIKFSHDIAGISAESFAKKYIFEAFKPRLIVIGYDFVFGHGRQGNCELLQKMSSEYNCKVMQVSGLRYNNEIVSSSRIRNSIKNGQIELAAKLLGRPFSLKGIVVKGRQLGRQLGFPTANLKCEWETYPKPGVYVCEIFGDNIQKFAVSNVGYSPTVSDGTALRVEAYIFDFGEEIYGQKLKINFLKQLRDEQKFSNHEALKAQIVQDVRRAKEFLKSLGAES